MKNGKSSFTITMILVPVFFTGACDVFQTPQKDAKIEKPKFWHAEPESSTSQASTNWLKDFNDPRLLPLVNEALNNNPNLRATAELLIAAQSSLTNTRANRLPSLSANTSASRSRTNEDAAGGQRTYSDSERLRFSSSWEIDLWGRLRNLHKAAQADYQASIANYHGSRLSLAGRTASLWYQLISNENQLHLARQTLESYRKVQKIIERNYKAGTARSLDLQLSRNNVYRAERILRNRNSRRDDAVRNLEVVLGRYPGKELRPSTRLPRINHRVPAGLPAGLLNRRPDLLVAKKRIEASFHRAKAAKKNLLPSLSLTGSSGTSPSDYSHLLNPGYLISSISLSLSQSLFEGGSRKKDVRAALARNRATLQDYAEDTLEAFREVESALASEKWLREQEFYLSKELKQAALAEKQAERDYTEGVGGVDIIDLLESQRRASNARSSLIDLQNQRIQNRIDLHLALGGDFSTNF